MTGKPYTVRAGHCPHDTDLAGVLAGLRTVTEPLEAAWARLEAAEHIAIKANIVWPPQHYRRHAGRAQELVDEDVLRATLILLRERCQGQITVIDSSLTHDQHDFYFLDLLAEYGVGFINVNDAPARWVAPPGGGAAFARYLIPEPVLEADALVSLCTLKSHAFMGLTLSTKNLFGLCPVGERNRPRVYYHHIVRMPYFLADLADICRPTLNIVDGLVAQSGIEWGGDPLVTNCLLAGDQTLATDLCGAQMMGHDPLGDFPSPPFRRDRNPLLIAAQRGQGPASMDEIDFQHDLTLPVGAFDSNATDPPERVAAWHATMAEEALAYEADPSPYYEQYAGEYILLQGGRVLWHNPRYELGFGSRRNLPGADPGRAIWFKYVDPSEAEAERYGIYRRELLGSGNNTSPSSDSKSATSTTSAVAGGA